MVNTRMFVFKHPKYYKELRERNKSDQVISRGDSTEAGRRAPGPGHKPQAPSSEGSSENLRSSKPQASSSKPIKPQATSFKPQA
jgi:hypothetical protein